MTGTVRWFSADHGDGLIQSDEGGLVYYVTYQAIQTDGVRVLQPGARVTFTPAGTPQRPEAHRVTVLGT